MKKIWNSPELLNLGVKSTHTPETKEAFGDAKVICYLCNITYENSLAYNQHLTDIPGVSGGKTCSINPGNAEHFGYTS